MKGWLLGPWRWRRFCFVLSINDLWRGLYLDRVEGVLYVAPLPALIFGIRFRDKASNPHDQRPCPICSEVEEVEPFI